MPKSCQNCRFQPKMIPFSRNSPPLCKKPVYRYEYVGSSLKSTIRGSLFLLDFENAPAGFRWVRLSCSLVTGCGLLYSTTVILMMESNTFFSFFETHGYGALKEFENPLRRLYSEELLYYNTVAHSGSIDLLKGQRS